MVTKAEALANLTTPIDDDLIGKINALSNDDSDLPSDLLQEYQAAIKPVEVPDPPADPPAPSGDYTVEEVTVTDNRGADKVFKVEKTGGSEQYLVFKKADRTAGEIVMTGGQKKSKSQKRGGKKQRQTKRKMGGRRRSNRRR
jgi:hypothetical protein